MFCGQLSPKHIKNEVSVGDHAASVRRHLSEDSYKDTEICQRSYEEACMDQGSDTALNTIHAKTQGSCLIKQVGHFPIARVSLARWLFDSCLHDASKPALA